MFNGFIHRHTRTVCDTALPALTLSFSACLTAAVFFILQLLNVKFDIRLKMVRVQCVWAIGHEHSHINDTVQHLTRHVNVADLLLILDRFDLFYFLHYFV